MPVNVAIGHLRFVIYFSTELKYKKNGNDFRLNHLQIFEPTIAEIVTTTHTKEGPDLASFQQVS